MRVFSCPACHQTLFFENLRCVCGAEVAFDPEAAAFVAAERTCANRVAIACNWVAAEPGSGAVSRPAPGSEGGALCRSCAMTEVIPQTFQDDNQALWARAEAAKRWVLANLARWGWLAEGDAGPRPRFHLLSEVVRGGEAPVTMGHDSGLVTINVAEADPAEIVRRQAEMGEPYRTMIGHYRHELAHYLFERLVEDAAFAEAFRALFGDERADYGEALKRHYGDGPPAGWEERYVTSYASAHPHEDWAETVAHLLHLTDIVDTATAVNLVWPTDTQVPPDAYATTDTEALVHSAVDLGLALNQVNRAMGLADLGGSIPGFIKKIVALKQPVMVKTVEKYYSTLCAKVKAWRQQQSKAGSKNYKECEDARLLHRKSIQLPHGLRRSLCRCLRKGSDCWISRLHVEV